MHEMIAAGADLRQPMHKSFQPTYTHGWEGLVQALAKSDPRWRAHEGDRRVAQLGGDPSVLMGGDPLSKAIETWGADSVLNLENLDDVMTRVLATTEMFNMTRWFPHFPSINLNYQWIEHDSYGSRRVSGGFPDGMSPPRGRSKHSRGGVTLRSFGSLRDYPISSQIAANAGGLFLSPEEQEHYDGTIEALERFERALVNGNELLLSNSGVEVNFEGMRRFMARTAGSRNYVDMRGAPMTFRHYEEDAQTLTEAFVPSMEAGRVVSFVTPQTKSDLSIQWENRGRFFARESGAGFTSRVGGVPFVGYDSNYGHIPVVHNLFLDPVANNRAPVVADSGAPVGPTSVASKLAGSSLLEAGEYRYWVTAVGDEGESLPIPATGTPLTVVAGDEVTIAITEVTGAAFYRVYRYHVATGGTPADDSTLASWVGELPHTGTGTAAFVDAGEIVENTGVVMTLSGLGSNYTIADLAPLMKLPLGLRSTTREFILFFIAALAPKVWERCVFRYNVGRYIES